MNKTMIEIISFDITYQCNLRCLHCYNSSGTHDCGVELSDNQFLKIVDDITKIRPRSLCFCGGETLMRKDLLIKSIKRYSASNPTFGCNMVSNGILLTKNVAKELHAAGVNSVQISIDGVSDKSHNWIRGNKDALSYALEALKALNESNITINVACVPTKANINEIDQIIELCVNNNVKQLRLQPIMNLGRGKHLQDYYLNKTEYFILARKLKRKDDELRNKGLKIEWGDPISHIVNLATQEKSLNFLHINAYGAIMLSPYLPIIIGDLKNHTLQEYIDAGLQEMSLNLFVKKVASLINSAEKMSLNEYNNFPDIFSGQDIVLDVIEDNISEKTEFYLNQFNSFL